MIKYYNLSLKYNFIIDFNDKYHKKWRYLFFRLSNHCKCSELCGILFLTKGIMGKGIALKFKKKYPNMFKDYELKCNYNQVKLGVPYIYKIDEDKQILNFPTKNHWKNKSDIEDIQSGIKYIIDNKHELNITSIALPALGCGEGGLNWNDVKELLLELKELNIYIEIYEPK